MPGFKDKVVLVTGASRGIGAAAARAFAREGAKVTVNYNRSVVEAGAVVETITSEGGEAVALQADVADTASVSALVERTLARFGRIDVLVNNAGHLNVSPLDSMSNETWDEMIAGNLRSVFLMTRAVIPAMLAQGEGVIVNMSSSIAQKGMAGLSHYAAAKGAIIAFTKSVAREYGPRGIRVNAIAAGPIDTAMLGNFAVTPEKMSSHFALRRIGTAEDVTQSILFLAGPQSAYYTGQTLSLNGGDVMP